MKSLILDGLINHSFFDGLDSRELHFIRPFFEYSERKKGEILYNEGEKNQYVYFIIDGIIGLYKFNKNGEPKLIIKVGPNRVVGESALIDDSPKFVTAYAEKDLKLLILSHKELEKLSKKFPKISIKILRNILKFYNLLFQKVFSYYFFKEEENN